VAISEILDDTIGTWRRERPDLDFDGMALFLKKKAGLISRTPDPEDRRSALIRITPAGRRIADRAIELLAGHKNEAFSGLTDRQRESLDQLLDKVIDTTDAVSQSTHSA